MRIYIKCVLYLFFLIGSNAVFSGSYEDFFRAIRRDDAVEIKSLLARGFDPNTPDEQGRQGLMIALGEGSDAVAKLLLAWSATHLDRRTSDDETPLMLACLHGRLNFVKTLIERDADVNKPGWAPLHYAASGGHLEVIALLLQHHAYIDAESPNGTTPLMMAAKYGSPQSVQALLEAGADPALKNQLGLSALDFAKSADRVDAVQLLQTALAEAPTN